LDVNHFIVGAVAGDRVRPVCGFFEGDSRIGEKRAGDDSARAVEVDGLLMRLDDERAFAAADSTDIKRSI